MPTSAPGSNRRLSGVSLPRSAGRGFTLLELLIVVAIIALAAGVSSLALRDGPQQRLEEEAVRLSALLEAARLESRASGQAAFWSMVTPGQGRNAAGDDFRFDMPRAGRAPTRDTLTPLPRRWLHAGTTADIIGGARIVLGPEPILPPQRIRLSQGQRQLTIATDGLKPFAIEEGTAR